MKFINHIFNKHRDISISILAILSFAVLLQVFAAPPGSQYDPAETLDPNCTPGSANCSVDVSSGISIGDDIASSTSGSILYVNGANQLGQKPSHLFFDPSTLFVGIGTDTPTAKLHVADASSSDLLRIDSSGNGGSADTMVINNVGNVGIGTASPSNLLDVAGIGLISSLILDPGSSSNLALKQSANTDTGLYFPTEKTIDFYSDGGQMLRIGSGAMGTPTLLNGVRFYIKGNTDDDTAYALRADNSSASPLLAIRNDGNVGIGTVTPGAKLDVFGNEPQIQSSQVTGGTSTYYLKSGSNIWSIAQQDNFHGGNLMFNFGATSYATNAMEITTGGNVGIGTTTPGALLDVSGLQIDNDSIFQSAPSSDLTLSIAPAPCSFVCPPGSNLNLSAGNSGSDGGSVFINAGIGATPGNIILNGTSGGNVGINTTTPASTFSLGTPDDGTNTYGQMDVSNGAPGPGDCNDSHAGRFIYNKAMGQFYICDSTAVGWRHFNFDL